MVGLNSQVLIVLLLLLSRNSSHRVVACNQKDQLSLLIFKQGIKNSSDKLSSWSSDIDCCAWEGVQCDNITGRVTKLDLGNSFQPRDLQGEINLSLLNLEFLNYLDLSWNDFEAISIPKANDYSVIAQRLGKQIVVTPPFDHFANFSNLHYLDLSYNYNLSMENLHWLSQLSSLKYLNLSGINLLNQTNWLQSMARHHSLLQLRLSDCSLSNLRPSIDYVNFTSLEILDLSVNLFDSELPHWLFNLSSDISYIDLSSNRFRSQLPRSLLKLQNLKVLNLWMNRLNGTIPDWLGQHEHLQELDLSMNMLYGSIPSSVGNLSTLTDLHISSNNLRGNLPSSLGQLFNLKRLSVGGNLLFGVINEKFFSKLSNLEILDLSGSTFEFDLSPDWMPPFQLHDLDLSNTIQGPNFPTWIYSQRSLQALDISSSKISSTDENFWSFVANIQDLTLSNNSIRGDLSEVTFENCFSLKLDYNNFTGGLPNISARAYHVDVSHNSLLGPTSTLCQEKNNEYWWSYVDVSYNLLTGPLPYCLEDWTNAYYISFGNNKLTGEIPLDLSNLKILRFMNLENNEFSGAMRTIIPPRLQVMLLSSNQLVGNIPQQLCNLSLLHILDLSHNKFLGPIPQCVRNMTALADDVSISFGFYKYSIFSKGQELQYTYNGLFRVMDLSDNNLSGEIPPELFSLTQLQSLNLSQNHLMGTIPSTIGDMKNLESFDLSNNKLFGEIPQSMAALSFLSYLNLSNNNFTGQIPIGTQLQSFVPSSYTGNPEL